VVREAVRREARVDRPERLNAAVFVSAQQDDCIYPSKVLVDIFREHLDRAEARPARHPSHLEDLGIRGEQAEDCQRRSGIVAATDTAVIAELSKSLSRDHLWDHDGRLQPSLSLDDAGRPAVVTISAVEKGNQKPGVGERSQRP
jgi:hypothetical protein